MRLEHNSFSAGLALSAALGLVGLFGCSQDGQVNVSAAAATNPGGPSNAGPVPNGGITSLLVTINEVQVRLAAAEMEGNLEVDDGWITVFQGAHAINVLDAAADQMFLASTMVPAGRITQVRLILDPAIELVLDGKSSPVDCSACTHSGLKVVIPGGVTVEPGGTLDLTLAIDGRASLLIDANGYHLTPVIRVSNKPRN